MVFVTFFLLLSYTLGEDLPELLNEGAFFISEPHHLCMCSYYNVDFKKIALLATRLLAELTHFYSNYTFLGIFAQQCEAVCCP